MQTDTVIRFWPKTDVGRVRDVNEDSFLVDESLGLFIVADGMGGHAAGEVASNIAVHTCRETVSRERELIGKFERGTDNTSRKDVLRLMELAVQNACTAVYAEAQKDPSKRGMGTTLVALLIIGARGFIAHVGDSRIYLTRNGSVHQLTEDHSLINELLKRGRLTPEQIAKLNMKNAVTRAVGVYESVEVDTASISTYWRATRSCCAAMACRSTPSKMTSCACFARCRRVRPRRRSLISRIRAAAKTTSRRWWSKSRTRTGSIAWRARSTSSSRRCT